MHPEGCAARCRRGDAACRCAGSCSLLLLVAGCGGSNPPSTPTRARSGRGHGGRDAGGPVVGAGRGEADAARLPGLELAGRLGEPRSRARRRALREALGRAAAGGGRTETGASSRRHELGAPRRPSSGWPAGAAGGWRSRGSRRREHAAPPRRRRAHADHRFDLHAVLRRRDSSVALAYAPDGTLPARLRRAVGGARGGRLAARGDGSAVPARAGVGALHGRRRRSPATAARSVAWSTIDARRGTQRAAPHLRRHAAAPRALGPARLVERVRYLNISATSDAEIALALAPNGRALLAYAADRRAVGDLDYEEGVDAPMEVRVGEAGPRGAVPAVAPARPHRPPGERGDPLRRHQARRVRHRRWAAGVLRQALRGPRGRHPRRARPLPDRVIHRRGPAEGRVAGGREHAHRISRRTDSNRRPTAYKAVALAS